MFNLRNPVYSDALLSLPGDGYDNTDGSKLLSISHTRSLCSEVSPARLGLLHKAVLALVHLGGLALCLVYVIAPC